MSKINVILPDGSELKYDREITVKDIAFDIGKRLGKDAVAGRVDGKKVDLSFELKEDAKLEIITIDSEDGLDVLRHTAAHVMAQAVKRLYDGVKLAIGPTIEDGFYYDIDMDYRLSEDDLPEIEKEMQNIVEENYEIERKEMSREEAIEFVKKRGEDYKIELIEELEDNEVSFYKQGEFVDLCRGPHLPSTGKLKAFKLLNVAGAYWRGDENNKMLQRIYGTAFASEKELENHLDRLEEAKKRDHRKLGKELGLFSMHEEGPGFAFFHPKGMVIWNQLLKVWREMHRDHDYEEIKTPIILNKELWKRSGHWDHYKENMYFTEIDDEDYAVKPMNCPGGVLVYKDSMHSYRDFPLKLAELGLVHRHELSGTLHGLMRVRAFTQDDAHIYMLPEQVTEELVDVLELVDEFYSLFDFDYHIELSTRPEEYMGELEDWEKATEALREALKRKDLDYEVNEGDGAFYGPKIDVHLEDCLGRTWQCATIQLDFQMPERFDLSYIGSDGEEHRPVMIHRTVMGAMERFIGILIEHFAGAFPTWLAPVQVKILPVSEDQLDYALEVKNKLERDDIRVEIDSRDENLGYKIRQAQVEQVPYMLIVGSNEEKDESVSVRERREGDLGVFEVNEFRKKINKEIENKTVKDYH
ncbi:MAG: threonine--tRNA ligase [Halanaerobiales bacterium]